MATRPPTYGPQLEPRLSPSTTAFGLPTWACTLSPLVRQSALGHSATRAFGHSNTHVIRTATRTTLLPYIDLPTWACTLSPLVRQSALRQLATRASGHSNTHAIRTATRATLPPFCLARIITPTLFPPSRSWARPSRPSYDTRHTGTRPFETHELTLLSLPFVHTRIRHPFISVAPALYVLRLRTRLTPRFPASCPMQPRHARRRVTPSPTRPPRSHHDSYGSVRLRSTAHPTPRPPLRARRL